jgi:hypothetical protein
VCQRPLAHDTSYRAVLTILNSSSLSQSYCNTVQNQVAVANTVQEKISESTSKWRSHSTMASGHTSLAGCATTSHPVSRLPRSLLGHPLLVPSPVYPPHEDFLTTQ